MPTDASSGKDVLPFLLSSTGSPCIGRFPKLPSSPSSLLSSRWSYTDSPGSAARPANRQQPSPLSAPCIVSPCRSPSNSSLTTYTPSPQEEKIPFQFSDSIFEEKLLEDNVEADITWGDANNKSEWLVIERFVSNIY